MPKKKIEKELHSRIGASSCYRWSECPGSIRESAGIEGIDSDYAKEGTLAHEKAAEWLETDKKPSFKDCPDDMEEAVTEYVDSVLMEAELYGAELGKTFFVEVKFDLHYIDKSMFGTADCVLYNAAKSEYIIIDYKHGAGIPVDVENNVQLRYYALGALNKLELGAKKFTFVIIQPRCNHSDGIERRETITFKELMKFEKWLIEKVKATKDPKAPLKAGDWCRFCNALPICPEVKKTRNAVAKMEFKDAMSYSMDELKKAYESIPVLKDWIKMVDRFAYNEAMKGKCIPGYKLVEKRANRKWTSESEAVAIADKYFKDPEEFFDRKFKSPTQIEKLIPGPSFEKFSEVIEKKSSGTVLVPESDKRQEFNPADKALEEFDEFL